MSLYKPLIYFVAAVSPDLKISILRMYQELVEEPL